MTRAEAIIELKRNNILIYIDPFIGEISEWLSENSQRYVDACKLAIDALEQEPIGHCKDCKHWKDSDGIYRRDIYAESKCPMNCKEVYEGTGYCFLFESNEESEVEK